MHLRLGNFLGIPIEIDASWFVVFALIVVTLALGHFPQTYPGFSALTNWVAGFVAALLLFASVLIHELAHSLVAVRKGMGVSGITLFIFGGVSRMESEPKTAWDEFLMAAAGPAMSFVLAGVFWGLGAAFGAVNVPGPVIAVTGYLAVINLILGIFNLIPGFPLDGGRVLRAILWADTRDVRSATRIASYVGQGFGYLFMFLGLWIILSGSLIGGVWLIFIGWFLSNAAQSSYQQMLLHRALDGIHVGGIMTPNVPTVSSNATVEDLVHGFFLQKDYNAFPVVDGDEFRGIVTLESVREVPREQWGTVTVGSIAQAPEEERIIHPNDDAWEAMSHMAAADTRRLLVMDDHRLVGMVTRDNLMNLVRTKLELNV